MDTICCGLFVLFVFFVSFADGLQAANCAGLPLTAAPLQVGGPNLCPYVFKSGLSRPRGMLVVSNGDVIVIAGGSVNIFWDSNGDGISGSTETAVLATVTGLNHGIEVSERFHFLYASTATQVWRWPYNVGTRTSLGTGTLIIQNIPFGNLGHSTRTLRFDRLNNNLFVAVGSGANVDTDAGRSMIRQFTSAQVTGTATVSWTSGFAFAVGLRNEVGFRFDKHDQFWGVENGVDNVARIDWATAANPSGDTHTDSPCEELNLLVSGKFYGYPMCWSEGITSSPPGLGKGTQWLWKPTTTAVAWTSQTNTPPGPYSDAWCQNTNNVVKPKYCFPAHNAPMDILFDDFPAAETAWDLQAFVSFHGSWNRDPPDGYTVRRIGLDAVNNVIADDKFLLHATTLKSFRPVGLALWPCPWGKCLLVTDDAAGIIYSVAFNDPNPTPVPTPSPTPSPTPTPTPTTTTKAPTTTTKAPTTTTKAPAKGKKRR